MATVDDPRRRGHGGTDLRERGRVLRAVLFAASTAVVTPVGYQTDLVVYGPGGYRFTDYLRVGAPLQGLLTVVTTLGIAFFWGVT